MVKRFITFLRIFLPIVLLSTLVFGSTGYATPVTLDIVGVNDPYNKATAEFDYDSSTGTLNVSVTNVSSLDDPDYDPRVTAFMLNLPDIITDVSGFTFIPEGDPDAWHISSLNRDSIKTPEQLGVFDVAITTSNIAGKKGNKKNFQGGDPNDGIAIGDTIEFKLKFEGENLADLTTDSFINSLSFGDDEMFPLAVRFQRTDLDGEGSDMGVPGNPGPPGIVVPEPSALLLLGFGLIGIFGLTKKFEKR